MLQTPIDTWGSSPEERAASYPCDALIESPDLTVFRAIDIDAPAPLVFRWLCQMRVAPYSYDWIDNLGRRSPRQLVDGLDQLEVGQRVATIFTLDSFEPGRSITLDSTTPWFGHVVGTYQVSALSGTTSRLVVKLMVVVPGGVLGLAMRTILPAGDLVMMRKQLHNFRDLAERDARELGS